jgi:manganese/zinc/iron transport system permease protein
MTRTTPLRTREVIVVAGAVIVTFAVGYVASTLFEIRYTYTLRIVAAGGALLGAISGALGCFAVLRKQSLLGDALSHAALPGVAIAFLIAGRDLGALLVGAAIASWLGVACIRLVTRSTRIKDDAAMGIVLVGWFAAGIVGLTYIQGRPDANQAGLDTVIFGQAASSGRRDVTLLAWVSAISCAMVVAFWKRFKLVSFDPGFAGANGFRVALWSGVLSALIVAAIVMGLQLAGVVLMVGMLIAPGVAARQWTDRLEMMVPLAAIIGAFSGGVGAIVSAFDTDLPTGPMIIVVASVIVTISVLFAPRRGVIWVAIRRRNDARAFAVRTVLRDVYHYMYDHDSIGTPETFIVGVRGGTGRRALRTLLARGLLRRVEDVETGCIWTTTDRGAEIAFRDARNQQLWDLYRSLGDRLELPIVAEERERDIRAVLPQDSVDHLEEFLGTREGEPRVRD